MKDFTNLGASTYFWERIIQIIFTSSLGLQIISIYIPILKCPLKSMSPLKITLLMKLKNYQVMTGKRSYKNPKKDQSGCIRSLISMFRRLLSYRKHKSGQSADKKLVFLFFLSVFFFFRLIYYYFLSYC